MKFLEPNYDAYPGLVSPGGGAAPSTMMTGGGYLPYGNVGASDSGLPGSTDNPANWIDDTIGPTYELYPLPVAASGSPSPTGSGSPVPSTPPVAVMAPAAPPPPAGGIAPSGGAPVAGGAPATMLRMAPRLDPPAFVPEPMPLSFGFERDYCLNPAFHGERGGEKKAEEHVTREAQPVAFTVPGACNAVDLWFGPIEPAQGAKPHDFQHVIQTGKARVVDAETGAELNEESLRPGQRVAVIVPWRVAATAKIEAGRLRMAVIARFYAIEAASPPVVS